MAGMLPTLRPFVEAMKHVMDDSTKIAVVDIEKDLSFTYAELLSDVMALKTKLLAVLQLEVVSDVEEPRIAFLAPAGYDYVVAQWAIWAVGGICIPLCTSHPIPELVYTISDSLPAVVLLHSSFMHLKDELELNTKTLVLKPVFKELVPITESNRPFTIPVFRGVDWESRRAMIIYTSGTTANPKGCVTTHETISFQAFSLVEAWKYSPSDRLIHVLPLHHIHGIINGLHATLLSGGTVEMHPKFDPKVIWNRWAAKGSSTMFMAVPTVYSRLIEYFDTKIRGTNLERPCREGARALRLVVSGSAALPIPIKAKFLEITGQNLLERYGMTEIGMALSCGMDVKKRINGSVGWPLPGVQVRLTDRENGRVFEDFDYEDGMIEVKGPNIFLEYWRRPDAAKKEFTSDGWFKTGDVAKRDGNGAYFIQGRASVDLIKTGGYKVSALEVERKMLALDAVEEVVVVGVADEEWGQRVVAIVKQRAGTPALELGCLRKILKREMAVYKAPTLLKIVDEIERNAMGKVNKKQLVRKYWPDKV
ncbi:hypothetical protein FQN57_003513 [Myotisia sp. PD_48]|nr:hypothetical protein FQN57_003513 [Myotisia sp. PD_48]